ncbi:hypothetical protein RLIN73S_01755 [Rhodanobacter lindaniclasticus]
MRRSVRRASARTSSPPNTSEKPHESSEASMLTSAMYTTAPRALRGARASRSMKRATTGAVAST